MKHCLVLTLLILLSLVIPVSATQYYLSVTGSDANNGLSAGEPWLTPNHAVNCGDTIIAAASTAYSASNFASGKWGTVTCSDGNNVAWLICATFDACKISASGTDGMRISSNYWGVQGWEVTITASATHGACFSAAPPSTSMIHHIIFANDIANGCFANGFNLVNRGNASVDYFVIVGSVVYNAAQGNAACYSGISVYQPVQFDSLPGTHIYVAGNFSFGNLNPNPCSGGITSDGNGVIIDTPDGSQGGLPSPYAAQIVVDNNIVVANGGRGLEVFNNQTGSAHAPVYLRHNTTWGNNGDPNQSTTRHCGEILLLHALETQAFLNIAATNEANGCGAALYAYSVQFGDKTDSVYQDVGFSATGAYGTIYRSGSLAYGPDNLFGTNPSFTNATAPGAPSCGSVSSVPNCMATVIANFTPTNSAALSYGYQIPSPSPSYDPLFPQWLCNVTLPTGLVTPSCNVNPPSELKAVVR